MARRSRSRDIEQNDNKIPTDNRQFYRSLAVAAMFINIVLVAFFCFGHLWIYRAREFHRRSMPDVAFPVVLFWACNRRDYYHRLATVRFQL